MLIILHSCRQIQLTLDEHEAVLAEKARELADMVGEVSIKTVDTSEFDENAIHKKDEVEEEGYMGGKVCIYLGNGRKRICNPSWRQREGKERTLWLLLERLS